MFPFTHSGKIKVYPDNSEDFEARFKARLTQYFSTWDMIKSRSTPEGIEFQGHITRFSWNGFHFLNGVSSGSFGFVVSTKGEFIKLKLRFYEFFLMAFMFTIIPVMVIHKGMPDTFVGDSNETRWFAVAMIWGVFYFGNYLVSVMRANSFLKKIIAELYLQEAKQAA